MARHRGFDSSPNQGQLDARPSVALVSRRPTPVMSLKVGRTTQQAASFTSSNHGGNAKRLQPGSEAGHSHSARIDSRLLLIMRTAVGSGNEIVNLAGNENHQLGDEEVSQRR